MLNSELTYGYFDSPIGPLLVAGEATCLHYIGFPSGSRAGKPNPEWKRDDGCFREVYNQLESYFSGNLTRFDLPVSFNGTDFQNSVWKVLCEIPYGQTKSYGEIAAMIGKPTASRAVGAANGANPIPIVVPCHRVIGADSSLTGFGGGLEIKKFLLELECALPGYTDMFPKDGTPSKAERH